MTPSKTGSVTRFVDLQQQIALLANMHIMPGPVISCYLDLSAGRVSLEAFVRERITAHLAQVPGANPAGFEPGIAIINELLDGGLPPRSRGLAVFLTASGQSRLLSAMPFAVPFHNGLSISASPDLLPLIQLRERYGRFSIILARPGGLQLAEVNLGDVSVKAWAANPYRGGHDADGWPVGRIETTGSADLAKQVRLIERSLNRGGPGPLFMAGDVDVMQAIREYLAPATIDRLLGVVPTPGSHTLGQTAAVCLRSLLEYEASQAQDATSRALHGIRTHGHAVAGTAASLEALGRGIVDMLVVGSDFRPEPGWVGGPSVENAPQTPSSGRDPVWDTQALDPLDLRIELIRLAAQQRVPVEFVDSDALHYVGGVACLLSNIPEPLALPCPPRYGRLDLVA